MENFYNKQVNFDKLLEEIRASYPIANMTTGDGIHNDAGVRVIMPDGTQQATWDAIQTIVTNHNPAILTTEQAIQSERLTIVEKAELANSYMPDLRKILN